MRRFCSSSDAVKISLPSLLTIFYEDVLIDKAVDALVRNTYCERSQSSAPFAQPILSLRTARQASPVRSIEGGARTNNNVFISETPFKIIAGTLWLINGLFKSLTWFFTFNLDYVIMLLFMLIARLYLCDMWRSLLALSWIPSLGTAWAGCLISW